MFKQFKNKNYLNSTELIFKGMIKRRRLAVAAISHVRDAKQIMRVIK